MDDRLANIQNKASQVALSVLDLSRSTLLLHLRFMDRAIQRLNFEAGSEGYACDGRKITFSPRQVLTQYKEDRALVSRSLLHMLMHCIFRHHLARVEDDLELWDLACDIAAESMINELNLDQTKTIKQDAQIREAQKLQQEVKLLSAEKLFYHFRNNRPNPDEIARLQSLFYTDDHSLWHTPRAAASAASQASQKRKPKPARPSGSDKQPQYGDDREQDQDQNQNPEQENQAGSDSQNPDSQESQDSQDDSGENAESESQKDSDRQNDQADSDSRDPSGQGLDADAESETQEQSGEQDGSGQEGSSGGSEMEDGFEDELSGPDFDSFYNSSSYKEQEDFWKDISEEMEVALESFSKKAGVGAGNFVQNLKALNRERYDYAAFLKQFAVSKEQMKLNEDEFDYIYYCYGLDLYQNMPLIEPLEYKDVKRIEEFVIAIDTSGSVSGDLVQKFMQKTYNILKQEESFFKKINLHIIQCDYEIQEDVKITSQEEFDDWLAHMQLRGFGGTDFRPVFTRVQEMIDQKEFTNLRGLLYFTDGYGVFPRSRPPYQSAFVFVEDEYEIPEVPPWAIKLVLEPEEILETAIQAR